MKTVHRKDMTSQDFNLLARFCFAITSRHGFWGQLPFELGIVPMRVPVWARDGGLWKLASFKNVNQEALGIATCDFRRTCNYLQVKESSMVKTLFKFSILGVVPDQRPYQKLKFRQPFTGVEIDAIVLDDRIDGEGFILERRRAEGNFRK